MKLALDPYMLRMHSFREVCRMSAELGYRYLELSPREDVLPFFTHPRVDQARVREMREALRQTGMELASVLPLYHWSSPVEEVRQTAVRYWRRAIEVAVELGCQTMNSEFSGRPERAAESEGQFWRSMEELLPILESEGIELHIEPHPDDFVEDGIVAVDLVRAINSPNVRYLYCAPHTFHMGHDVGAMIRYAGSLLAHVHVADSLDHRASSGLRYIVNPPGSSARIHQHLDIGQGEVDWDEFFGALAEVGFDGIATACVFAWEERALDSARFMLEEIQRKFQAVASRRPHATRSLEARSAN